MTVVPRVRGNAVSEGSGSVPSINTPAWRAVKTYAFQSIAGRLIIDNYAEERMTSQSSIDPCGDQVRRLLMHRCAPSQRRRDQSELRSIDSAMPAVESTTTRTPTWIRNR
jgi:hypothetical protein